MVASEVREPQTQSAARADLAERSAVIAIYLLANGAYFHVLSARGSGASATRGGGNDAADSGRAGRQRGFHRRHDQHFRGAERLHPHRLARALRGGARRLFFQRASAAFIRRYHTPGVSILALSAWAALLVLSGKYEQLFTYVIFPSWILYGMTTAAVIVLRKKRPDLPRPYRTFGYPFVPVLFVLVAAVLVLSTLLDSPRESLMGIGLILLGLPFYFYWKKRLPGKTYF